MAGSDRIILAQPIAKIDASIVETLAKNGLERQVQQAIYKLGQETRDMARRKAPKKTGALRASIYVSRPNDAPPDAEGKSPTTKRMTAGYFRAVNAAVRLNKRLELREDDPTSLDEPQVADYRTQVLRAAAGIVSGKVQIGKRVFKTQQVLDEDELPAPTQSIAPFQKSGRSSFFVTVGAAAHYAGFVEFGHTAHGKPVAPVPFLVPAMDWAAGQIAGRLKAVIEEGTKKNA